MLQVDSVLSFQSIVMLFYHFILRFIRVCNLLQLINKIFIRDFFSFPIRLASHASFPLRSANSMIRFCGLNTELPFSCFGDKSFPLCHFANHFHHLINDLRFTSFDKSQCRCFISMYLRVNAMSGRLWVQMLFGVAGIVDNQVKLVVVWYLINLIIGG